MDKEKSNIFKRTLLIDCTVTTFRPKLVLLDLQQIQLKVSFSLTVFKAPNIIRFYAFVFNDTFVLLLKLVLLSCNKSYLMTASYLRE